MKALVGKVHYAIQYVDETECVVQFPPCCTGWKARRWKMTRRRKSVTCDRCKAYLANIPLSVKTHSEEPRK